MFFRRNQLDAALYALLGGPFADARNRLGQKAPQAFLTRIKRLIEIDRKLGAAATRDRRQPPMAFHNSLPAGTGIDVEYSPLNAFVLAIALDLVRFGFKQAEVVEKLVTIRSDLELAFRRSNETLETHGGLRHTDASKSELPTYLRRTHNRDTEAPDPAIFLIMRQLEPGFHDPPLSGRTRRSQGRGLDHEIAHGWKDLTAFLQRAIPRSVPSVFVIELSEMSARIQELLKLQPVRKRGRPAS